MGPEYSLLAVFFMLVIGASHWRRTRLRKAVRNLPTRARRLLGPEPEFLPPPEPTDDLRPYAALHLRTRRVMHGVWALGFVWLAYVLFLLLKGAS